jgi:hypothetical protein
LYAFRPHSFDGGITFNDTVRIDDTGEDYPPCPAMAAMEAENHSSAEYIATPLHQVQTLPHQKLRKRAPNNMPAPPNSGAGFIIGIAMK